MYLPITFLIAWILQVTGPYFVLAVFSMTAIVKIIITWLYPRLIAPIFASNEQLPKWTESIQEHVREEAKEAGIHEDSIYLSRKPFYDFHSSASCFMGRITLDINIFWNHGDKPAEILAILSHECGHYKESHLLRQTVVDTAYMILFALGLYGASITPSLLLSFQIAQDSAMMTVLLYVSIWATSADMPLRMGINAVSRRFEYLADRYAVERGYGQPLIDSLIRSHAISLETLFYGNIDFLLCSTHP